VNGDGRELASDQLGRRHRDCGRVGAALPRALIAAEKERAIVDDRTARRAAELVIAQRWFGQAAALGEEIVGLETFVAKELETRAVDGVRAGLDDHADHAACRASVFGAVIRGLHLELLNRVDGRPYRL